MAHFLSENNYDIIKYFESDAIKKPILNNPKKHHSLSQTSKKFFERFLPRIHFDDSHTGDNLIGHVNSFIRDTRSF